MNNEEEFTPRVITLKVTEYRYVAELKEFNGRLLLKDWYKVLQGDYTGGIGKISKGDIVYKLYEEEVKRLSRLKVGSNSKKAMLVQYLSMLKEKFTDRFSKYGWYNIKREEGRSRVDIA